MDENYGAVKPYNFDTRLAMTNRNIGRAKHNILCYKLYVKGNQVEKTIQSVTFTQHCGELQVSFICVLDTLCNQRAYRARAVLFHLADNARGA